MLIGIVETGHLPADVERACGSYPAMIRRVLGPAYTYAEFDAVKGVLPAHDHLDAVVITGSAASVYDDESWIGKLKTWLSNSDPDMPLIGICFGHQLMATVFGGEVGLSPGGPELGLRQYRVDASAPWMQGQHRIGILAANRDQVIVKPASADTVLASESCPYAALSYRGRRAISVQAHPEFSTEFTEILITRWLERGLISPQGGSAASASLCNANDSDRVIRWFKEFLAAS